MRPILYVLRAIPLCLLLAAGCGDGGPAEDSAAGMRPAAPVESSGKSAAALGDVPAEVLETARRKRPEIAILEAEYETRDGREYYDVAGVMPDGGEVELDMTRVDGQWTVVEIQRDIGERDLPEPVAAALEQAAPGFDARRIIESDQDDGTIVYEFFGPGGSDAVKHEVKWANGEAVYLDEEWAH